MLLIARSNFLFTNPNADALQGAISKVPLVVSFSPFIDETSTHAHLIIPDHDDLEKLDAFSSLVTGSPVVSVQRPVLKPFYATTHTGDVLLSLTAGLKLSSSITASTYEAYLRSSLKPVYEHGKGTLMSQKKPTELEKSLHQSGWQTDAYTDYDEFWEQMLKYGGWWNPYRTRTAHKPVVTIGREQLLRPGASSVEHAAAHDTPLRLNVFARNLDFKGNIGRNAILTEQFGMEHSVYYETWAEINPSTARRFSITDRSRIKVSTAKGAFEAVAVFNAAVMPAMVDVPFGLGHTVPGPVHGINPIAFCDDIFDDATGTPASSESIVQIERVGGTA